jgi:hypothetical protein
MLLMLFPFTFERNHINVSTTCVFGCPDGPLRSLLRDPVADCPSEETRVTSLQRFRSMLDGIEQSLDPAPNDYVPRSYIEGFDYAISEVRRALDLVEASSKGEDLYYLTLTDRRDSGGALVLVIRPVSPEEGVLAPGGDAESPGEPAQDSATLRKLRVDKPGVDNRTRSIEITPEKEGG